MNFLVNEKERNAILAAANERDLSLSDYMRQSTVGKTYKVGDEELTEAEAIALSHILAEIGDVADRVTKRVDRTLAKLDAKWDELNALRASHGLEPIH